MVQTVNHLLSRTYYSPLLGNVTQQYYVAMPSRQLLRPLLDDGDPGNPADPTSRPSKDEFYDGINKSVGTPLTTNDSPGTPLELTANDRSSSIPYTFQVSKYNVSRHFTMTLMYQPPGGVWVPLGNIPNWGYAGVVTRVNGTFATGPWTLSATTRTLADPYAASSDYPNWVESTSNLAVNGYVAL